eukprot:gene7633-7697_t
MFSTININEIDTRGRLRPADPAYVEALAASIEERGLDQMIKLRPIEGGNYALVYGMHRLEAMKLLGWAEIEKDRHFTVESLTNEAARLAEIDENLMRRELTALDRAIFLLERKRVYENMHPETAHGKAPKGKAKKELQSLQLFLPPRFTVDAANKVGLSSRSIHLAVEIANRLDPAALDALRKTPLVDNQAALQKFAEETPENQRAIAAKMAGENISSLQDAKISLGLAHNNRVDPEARRLVMLMSTWDASGELTRKAFLDHIGIGKKTAMSGDFSFNDEEIVNAYKYFTAGYTPFQFVEALSVGSEL